MTWTLARSPLSLLPAKRLSIRTLSFASPPLNPALINALQSVNISKPTWIQQSVIPQILARNNVVFADQTGSGKTIAYLLPLLHVVKSLEEGTGLLATPGYPRAVVLAPSRELAVQISDVAKMFSHHIKLTTRLVVGGRPVSQQKQAFKSSVDIVVATPGRLQQLIASGLCRLSHTKIMIFDEADTLFDTKAGFMNEIRSGILKRLPKSAGTQFICVSATLTKQSLHRLQSTFPNVKAVVSNQLHKIPPKLKVHLIEVGGKDKLAELLSLVRDIETKFRRIVVFCNTVDSCRAVEHGLIEAGFPKTTSIHGGILPKTRAANYESFLSESKPILIATDISCRGIDLPSSTSIVMFDFPPNLNEFLHRAGRTARIGNDGVVYALTTKRDQTLSQRIKFAVETGNELDLSSLKPNSCKPPTSGLLRQRRFSRKQITNKN